MTKRSPIDNNGSKSVVKKQRGRPPTLILLLKSLVGLRVRIDLKNDVIIEGIVQEVLHDTDFTLLDATQTTTKNQIIHMDEVFVMGKTILYVHIPDHINISKHLHQYMQMLRNSKSMYSRSKRT